MSISPRQRQLRAAIEACRTPTDVFFVLDQNAPGADSDWAHIAKSLRVFDAELVEGLKQHPRALPSLERNRAFPPAMRDALHVWFAETLAHPDVHGVLRTAASTGRLRMASPAMTHLLAHARLRTPEGHVGPQFNTAVYILKSVRDLPVAIAEELAVGEVLEAAARAATWEDDMTTGLRPGRDLLGGEVPQWPAAQFQRVVTAALGAGTVGAAGVARFLLPTATAAQLATLTADQLAPCLALPSQSLKLLAMAALADVQPSAALIVSRPIQRQGSR